MTAHSSTSSWGGLIVTLVFGIVIGWTWWAQRSRKPLTTTTRLHAAGRPTMELRPEPPTIAGALVNLGATWNGAMAAALLDLAARGHLELFEAGQHRTIVFRRTSPDPVQPYEQRFLTPLDGATSASAGLPLGEYVHALGFGSAAREDFRRRIHSELLARGLLRRVGGFLSWERLTPAGHVAVSHWLGVREFLRQDDCFATLTPAAVEIWDRYLAYAAAFGVAFEATAPIIAAFASQPAMAEDVTAAIRDRGAYAATAADFRPQDHGITGIEPFGPDGAHPTGIEGLLAGWHAVTVGMPLSPDWARQLTERIATVRATVPGEAAADVEVVLCGLAHASAAGARGAALGPLFADVHAALHRFFADASARAEYEGSDAVRRWMILRRIVIRS